MHNIKVGDRVIYKDSEVAPVIEVLSDGALRVKTEHYDLCTEYLEEEGGDVSIYQGS